MDGNQGITHSAAGRDGDTYVLVSWDDETNAPVFTPEMAYDGHEGVKIHYSHGRQGEIECATKRWRVEQGNDAGYVRRLNIYYPNRIEKYISDGRFDEGNWREYLEEDETGQESHIKWWSDNGAENGNRLGVPVFHFKANDRGYNYGKSDLHDIIPIQNALNKSMIDLLAAADTTGFRMFTVIGDDPTGWEFAPGMVLYSTKSAGGTDETVKIDFMPGEDLSPMITLKDSMVAEIARVSRTPLSYFQTTGAVAAEGTLKQQESGLLAKVVDRQVGYGNTWEDVMSMARRLNNAFGDGPEMDEDQEISTFWKDPETRNELTYYEALAKKYEALQIPVITRWREEGYTDDDIDQMLADAAANDGFGFVGANDEVEQ